MAELHVRIQEIEREARRPQTVTQSVAEALHQHRRLVVVGGPGSGKTTLTRWLALAFAQGVQGEANRLGPQFGQPRLPILLELRRFASRFAGRSEVPHLADEIVASICSTGYYANTPAQFVAQALAEGRCILLIDGLDEIADVDTRRVLVDAIDAFFRRPDDRYRDNLCLVTSRPYGYRDTSLGAGFQTSQVKPFEAEDVRTFIEHWYETAYGDARHEEAGELIGAVGANPRVMDLVTNPLLCTIIAIVYRNNRVLPNRRVDLYLKCCEALLDTWERNKDIKESGLIGRYDWQTKLELLAPLAFWLHGETERLAAPEEQFVEQLAAVRTDRRLEQPAQARPEARRFLEAIRDRSGLLQGRGDGSLEFAHRTFQEYLVARHIAAQPDSDPIDLVMAHLHEAWWREVHLLTIGHLGSGQYGAARASSLLLYVLNCYRPPFRLLRSRSILNSSKEVSLHPDSGSLAGRLPGWQFRRRIAWMLAREFELAARGFGDCKPLGVTEQVENAITGQAGRLLTAIVYDPGRHEEDPGLALLASQLLRGQATDEVRSQVVKALVGALDYGSWRVRQAAANSLVQLGAGSDEVVKALVGALEDRDNEVRRAAARSLVQQGAGSDEVVKALVRALGDRDQWAYGVRRAAASSLGQLEIKDEARLCRLLVALNRRLHDTDDDVRRAALKSIRKLLDGRPIPGYKWTPLRVRRQRRRRILRAGFWLGVVFVVMIVALAATWLLTDVDPNSFWVRFLVALGAIVGFGSGIAQILGRAMRSPWDRE